MTVVESLHEEVMFIARKFVTPSWTGPDGQQYCLRGRIYRAVQRATAEPDKAKQAKMKAAIEGMDKAFLSLMAEFNQKFEQYRETAKFTGDDWETEFSVPPCQCPGCRAMADNPPPTMRIEI